MTQIMKSVELRVTLTQLADVVRYGANKKTECLRTYVLCSVDFPLRKEVKKGACGKKFFGRFYF